MEGRCGTPWLPCGVKYSDEASAWLLGVPNVRRGWRERVADPSELEAIAIDDFNAGWGVGIFIWNEKKGHPEHIALDNAGLRYLPDRDGYQYHGWSRVFDVEPGNGIWTLKTRVKSDPWRDGAWHKLAYPVMDALQAEIQRGVWMHVFSMPTVLAKYPLGSSDDQKVRFTQSFLGTAIRVIGATAGYDMDFKQASAEGAQTFKDVEERLERAVSILVWGTVGLLAGGSGFANSQLFEQMKSGVVAKEAWKQATFENDQIWPVVLDWAARAGHISRSAVDACIEYNPETPAVILNKASAAKALMDAGYTPEEAQRRAGIEKQAYDMPDDKRGASAAIFAYHIEQGIVTPNEVRQTLGLPPTAWGEEPRTQGENEKAPADARLEEFPEASYSETLAARMNERGDLRCPHDRDKYCPSCGVRRRHEERDGQWVDTWMPVVRSAA
jgi:hypothetical protein